MSSQRIIYRPSIEELLKAIAFLPEQPRRRCVWIYRFRANTTASSYRFWRIASPKFFRAGLVTNSDGTYLLSATFHGDANTQILHDRCRVVCEIAASVGLQFVDVGVQTDDHDPLDYEWTSLDACIEVAAKHHPKSPIMPMKHVFLIESDNPETLLRSLFEAGFTGLSSGTPFIVLTAGLKSVEQLLRAHARVCEIVGEAGARLVGMQSFLDPPNSVSTTAHGSNQG